MAENDQEKTEYLSQRKLEESRHKGELPKSRELNTLVALGTLMIFFQINPMEWFNKIGGIMSRMLHFDRYLELNVDSIGEFLLGPAIEGFMVFLPVLTVVLVLSPLMTLAQTRFNLATEKIQFDLNRINPASGMKRMFSKDQWFEGLKSCLKILVFAWLAWTALRKYLPQILVMGSLDLPAQLQLLIDVSLSIGMRICLMMLILSIVDTGWQWRQFNERMKMTFQELKDESKEREGDPLIKQRQRSMAMQRLRKQMMAAVPNASVVVTNPTHFAVALTYDRNKAPAPFVCAKGVDFMAMRIREMAKEHNIPIVENRLLARTLYKNVKVGGLIPGDFYKAVAEVLAFVFLAKQRRAQARMTAQQSFVSGAGQAMVDPDLL